MKKSIFLVFAVILTASVSSFSQGFDKGVSNVNLGLNLGWGVGIQGSYDVGITEQISVGAGASFNTGYWGYNSFAVGGRGAYHFGAHFNDWFNFDDSKSDPYVGAVLGFRGLNGNGTRVLSNGVYFGGMVGYRYGFSDSFGVYAEAGSPYSSIGITFKL